MEALAETVSWTKRFFPMADIYPVCFHTNRNAPRDSVIIRSHPARRTGTQYVNRKNGARLRMQQGRSPKYHVEIPCSDANPSISPRMYEDHHLFGQCVSMVYLCDKSCDVKRQ